MIRYKKIIVLAHVDMYMAFENCKYVVDIVSVPRKRHALHMPKSDACRGTCFFPGVQRCPREDFIEHSHRVIDLLRLTDDTHTRYWRLQPVIRWIDLHLGT